MWLALVFALIVALAGVLVPAAWATAFDDGTPCPDTKPLFVCPQGTVDAAYSIQLQGRAGCTPYEYRILNGALPSGLSLSSTGVISGTPRTAGASTFWVELKDVGCPPDFGVAEREFSISVQPRVLVTTESAASGTIGVPYTLNLTAVMKSGPDSNAPPSSPLAWSVVAGTMPPGITLDASTGALSGAPTTEGSYGFTVKAALVDGRSDTKALNVAIRQPLAIAAAKPLASTPIPTLWEVGVPFSAKLTPSGGSGTYTYTLASGSLPTGLALAADGSLVGTPRAAGVFRAVIRLSDTEGRTLDYAANFGVAARLAISTLTLRSGKVGKRYVAKLKTTGGILPRTWRITSGPLPRGVRLDRKLGILSGTPTRAGTYRVTVQVTDGLKVVATKKLRIDVLDA
jgi:hypothetical protein